MRLRIYRFVRMFLLGFIAVSLANLLFTFIFNTPKMYGIDRENREMVLKYGILRDKIRSAERTLAEIKHRDNYIYRSLFSTDTLAVEGIYTPYPAGKYAPLQGDEYSDLMTSTWQELDALGRKLYLQSLSLDQLQILSKNKEKLSLAIPAIWPIDRTKLKNNHIGAYGRRFHPIYKVWRKHEGIDLAGSTGDPIFATGDAVVEKIDRGRAHAGYGQQILLNHDFGYKTRYAHLSRILVKPGDRVTRGQIIGEMGNTGGSTSPHLHYEVIYMGRTVNPVNYFNRNMTHEEYKNLMEHMRETDLEVF